MLKPRMEQALAAQMNAELYSAYLYLSMSNYFKTTGLDGFAHWMHLQAQEELSHGMKFYEFIHQRGGSVALAGIAAPPAGWESPLAVFEATLAHERKVTGLIHALVETAAAEKDHATLIFLQWFVTEQVEEEESAGAVLQRLALLGADKGGLFMLDREMAARGPAPAAAE